jgi:hypothetical protein
VYLKDSKGNLTSLGWTQNNYYNYTAPSSGTYTFVIKSSYSIFKTNQSSGIEIEATVENGSGNVESTSLKAKTLNLCVTKNGTLNAKKALTVTYDGEDVTNESVITASQIDTSTTGEKTVTYSISYNQKQIQITGKVTVADSCS